MLTLRKPRLCMFLAFAMVGMWHKVSAQYLVWGLGHGTMLVAYMTLNSSAFHKATVARINRRIWTALSWLVTLTLVSFLSNFAGQPTFDQSLAFTRALVPGW
jgi:D-alanyl-lipoteichoic acid acyltransferase DltB (MBOAT superfamily)